MKSYSIFYMAIVPSMIAAPAAVSAKNETENTAQRIESITVLGNANRTGAHLGGTDLDKLPFNTHVVGRAEMERLKFVDPDEFLDRIPGETQVRNLRIPDGGKGYTLPLLDGIPMENPYEGATQRLNRTNTFDIERVEIIKGPSSALYPNNAFGGVVNVVTRDAPAESETLISLEAGEFNRLRARASTGGSTQNMGYFFDINTQNIDGLRDETVNDREQASAKIIAHLSDNDTFTTRAEYLKEDTVSRGDLTAEELDEDNTQAGGLSSATDLEQQTLSFRYEHETDQGYFDSSLVYREKDTIGLSRFRGPQDENDKGYNAKLQYTQHWLNWKVIGGYDLYHGVQDTKQFDRRDLTLSGDFLQFENRLTIHALYLQSEFEASRRLTLSAGARYEDIRLSSTRYPNDGNFSDIAPKLGATYQLNKSHLLWVSLAEGFYAPDTNDLFDVDEGNPELDPEEAQNLEIGLRGDFGGWRYDISAYQMDVTNYLVTQEFTRENGDEFERTTNAGEVDLRGIETVLEYHPQGANWRFGLTHTYTQNKYERFVQSQVGAEDDLSGKVLRRSPDHHWNLRLAWLPTDRLTIELEGDYYSDYFADNVNSPESRFTRGERINLRVDYEWQQWRFWLHALNLTDTLEDRATFRRGRMQFRTIDGRTFYAGASYAF